MSASLLLAGILSAVQAAPVEEPADTLSLFREGAAALRSGDAATAVGALSAAAERAPRQPTILFLLARARARAGDAEAALAALERVATLGGAPAAAEEEDLEGLRGEPRFEAVLEAFARNAEPIAGAEVAFRLERDLIPEGIAWDAAEKVLYLSSTWGRKVVRVDASGDARDFVPEAGDGLLGALGMEVDPRRRWLWVAHAGGAMGFRVPPGEDAPPTALDAWDLSSGRRVARHLPPGEGERSLNDLTVAPDGTVYATDSVAQAIYALRPGASELVTLARSRDLSFPNGLALAADGARLYVAHIEGISVVDVASGEVARLEAPGDVSLAGIDGLERDGDSLVALQALSGVEQVRRFRLDPTGTRVETAEVLARNDSRFVQPTTGVVAGDRFYFVATSQFGAVGPDGLDEAALVDTLVMWVALR
jgi:sugar lactone lactonase YvrE